MRAAQRLCHRSSVQSWRLSLLLALDAVIAPVRRSATVCRFRARQEAGEGRPRPARTTAERWPPTQAWGGRSVGLCTRGGAWRASWRARSGSHGACSQRPACVSSAGRMNLGGRSSSLRRRPRALQNRLGALQNRDRSHVSVTSCDRTVTGRAMRSAVAPTVARMRPITLICALATTLHFATADALASAGWTWPVRGPVLTPYRNGGNPYAGGQHRGVDIGAPVGSRVVAAVGGTVTYAGVVGSSGLTVSERTADGRLQLSYLHLSSVAVHRSDVLAPGAPVGAVGVSGRRSVAAPHLHFGVREAGSRNAYLDPLDFLAPPAGDRAPRPVPAPIRIPHPAVPAPARVRPRAVHGAPKPHTAPGPVPHGVPVARPLPAPRPHHAPVRLATPEPLHGPEAAPGPVPARATPAPVHRGGSRSHGGGINVGWLLACLGLIAAATALGGPDATRKLATRGRARLTGLLRPASRGG
jgi:hypothetical protein